jgi:hypothetical protein
VSEYQGGFEADFDNLRPSISADSRFVAFDSDAANLAWGDTNDVFDVFVKDRQTDLLTRVSVDDAGRRAATACGPRSAPTGESSRSIPTPRTSSRATRTGQPTVSAMTC